MRVCDDQVTTTWRLEGTRNIINKYAGQNWWIQNAGSSNEQIEVANVPLHVDGQGYCTRLAVNATS